MANKDKRQEILRHGFEVMYSKGFHATSIQDVADAAGIPKGSFYHYFKTKEQFTLDAITLYTDLVHQEMKQVLTDTALPPLKRIVKLYHNRIGYYQSRQYELGCFAGNLTHEVADSNELLRAAIDTFFVKNRALIVDCLNEAQANDELDKFHNTEDLSEYIISSYEGALVRMKSLHSAKPLEIFQKYLEKLLA
ncbi:MAG: TetR family transcriptional regulator C-terminal domain-containing protein [Chloroflexota bacterium]